MNPTMKRFAVNLMSWGMFGLVLYGLNQLDPALRQTELEARAALGRLLEPKVVILQSVAVVLLIGLLWVMSERIAAGEKVAALLELLVEEAASLVTNLASLLIVIAIATSIVTPLVTAILLYAFAYCLLVKRHDDSIWRATYPKIPEVQEEVLLRTRGQEVTGWITAKAGPDAGRKYSLRGSYRDRTLAGFYDEPTRARKDKGVFLLELSNDGERYLGWIMYTHDEGTIEKQPWQLRKPSSS